MFFGYRWKAPAILTAVLILFSLITPNPASSAPCATPGLGGANGPTELGTAAGTLSAGSWCELSTNGLTWELIQPAGGGNCSNENHLEYGSTGVYDPVRKTIGVLTGPHSGTVGGGCSPENIVFLLYDEESNSWSLENQNTTGLPNGGHGYDLTSIDQSTGDMYVSIYNTTGLWRRSANGNWQNLGNNPIINCSGNTCASGSTWDSRRGGYIRFGDSAEQGVTIWKKSSGNWSQIASHNEFGGFNSGFHYWAGYHRSTGLIWLQDGNGSRKHWKLNTNDTVSALSQPPVSLGCCGSGGRLSAYDFRTDRFVVAIPTSNVFYDYDIVNDSWTNVGTKVPIDWPSGDLDMFVTSIDAYGGLLMYVVGQGTGNAPNVYLYKHSGVAAPVKRPAAIDDLTTLPDP